MPVVESPSVLFQIHVGSVAKRSVLRLSDNIGVLEINSVANWLPVITGAGRAHGG